MAHRASVWCQQEIPQTHVHRTTQIFPKPLTTETRKNCDSRGTESVAGVAQRANLRNGSPVDGDGIDVVSMRRREGPLRSKHGIQNNNNSTPGVQCQGVTRIEAHITQPERNQKKRKKSPGLYLDSVRDSRLCTGGTCRCPGPSDTAAGTSDRTLKTQVCAANPAAMTQSKVKKNNSTSMSSRDGRDGRRLQRKAAAQQTGSRYSSGLTRLPAILNFPQLHRLVVCRE